MKRVLPTLFLLCVTAALAACNTIEGAGRDIQEAGEEIEEAAEGN